MRRKLYTAASAAVLAAGLAGALAPGAHADELETDGRGGVISGNQVSVPVDVDGTVCSASVAVGGSAAATCEAADDDAGRGGGTDGAGDPELETDGRGGVGSGNQIYVPVDIEALICGNSLAAIGISAAECQAVTEVLVAEQREMVTDGQGGIASGNQISIPIEAAATVCGNAVAVLGISAAACEDALSSSAPPAYPEENPDPSPSPTPYPSTPEEEPEPESPSPTPSNGPGEPPPADGPQRPAEPGTLPVTGAQVGLLAAAAAAATAAGGALLLLARRRRRAAQD
ncbi:chaplin family protein [Allonocardiopsis opalescens]|uniref:LPXTG-motif cell wall-anchored protein n=1 Tax=Allonocardiopsis opalescens TaxID=1144618 RepID=A0A2T0Q287_9ACTN|nr:chaplin family protein [Allonocardiopsis opalescens]PRX97891.1 LPXTG-motif cell wall-anchored protein [Allonocardiopsis opalescens]